jgi:hypothetical protein
MLTGRVHGSTIDLDAVPSAPFEGKGVRVVLELVDDDVRLGAEHGLAWNAWVTHGPDAPLEHDARGMRVSLDEQHELSVGLPNDSYAHKPCGGHSRRFRTGRTGRAGAHQRAARSVLHEDYIV